MSIFNDKVLKSVAEAAAKVMQAEATKPMTDKEKSLAALGHPKDKITHKDVLIGRGVLKKEEVEHVEEGWDDMMKASKERQGPQPSGGAGVKKGTRYGGGRQKDEPETGEEEKKSGRRAYGARQNFKRSTRVNEGFIELLQKYNEEGLKVFATLEEEPDNEQFTKEFEDQKSSMAGKKKQPSVAAPSTQGVKQMPEEVEVFDADEINGTTVNTIDERTLSEPESAKKEEIVKSMKKKMTGFKQRYGERAKSVMYATATKLAKKD